MTNFIVVEKDSLNKVSINTQHITLTEASIVHTKMHRNDVAEFLRDGNNLILKLNNGETVLIENFFVVYDKVDSDLVFEEDGCILYWGRCEQVPDMRSCLSSGAMEQSSS